MSKLDILWYVLYALLCYLAWPLGIWKFMAVCILAAALSLVYYFDKRHM